MKKNKQIENLQDERYGLHMTNNSYNLQVMYGRNYLRTNNNQVVKIHKINVIESKSHKLYGQAKAKDKVFMPPVSISVMINVEDGQQSFYGDNVGGIVRDDSGNLTFGVYLEELKEKKISIDRGDIVEYNMSGEKARYYEVESANKVVDTTAKTIGGFKPYFRKVISVPVKEDVVPFLSETKGS
ncbi:MAG: hypothetical protein ACOC22_00410 [bacterium]